MTRPPSHFPTHCSCTDVVELATTVIGFVEPHGGSRLLTLNFGDRPETTHILGGRWTVNLPFSPTATLTEPVPCHLESDTVPSMGRGSEIPASNVKVPETVPVAGGLVFVGEVVPHAARETEPKATAKVTSIRFICNLEACWSGRIEVSHLLERN